MFGKIPSQTAISEKTSESSESDEATAAYAPLHSFDKASVQSIQSLGKASYGYSDQAQSTFPTTPSGSSPTSSVQNFLNDSLFAQHLGGCLSSGGEKAQAISSGMALDPAVLSHALLAGGKAAVASRRREAASPSGFISACSSPPQQLADFLTASGLPYPGLGAQQQQQHCGPSPAPYSAAAAFALSYSRGSSPTGSISGAICKAPSFGNNGTGSSSMTITADTDPFKAAGMLAYMLSSQPPAGSSSQPQHCILRIQPHPSGVPSSHDNCGLDGQMLQHAAVAQVIPRSPSSSKCSIFETCAFSTKALA